MSYRRNEKMEEELAQSMKKALVADQSGPKQKHVRAIILYTWDMQGAGSFWTAITTYPLLGDDTVAFKAMITIHKVISQGHSACLKDAVSQKTWIKKLANGAGYSGYSKLIAGYAEYLCNKIDFHRDYPAFSGTFDYEEYVSLRGIDNPDEGYETISSLLALLVKLDALQKLIFQDFRGASSSEARVASLVPLVEESYGIYQFLVSMLTAMHQIIGSAEVMGPLRDQFNQSHYALLQFYSECSAINYLTSLVTVPVLSREPPNFLAQGQPTRQPKANPNKQNEEAEKAKMRLEREEMERESMMQQQMQMRQQQEMEARQRMEMEQRQFQQQELERQQRDDMLRRQEFERMQRQEQERFRLQQQQQEQQMSQSRLLDAQSQMDYLQKQSLQDRSTIEQYHRRMAELEAQMSKMAVENAGAAQKQGTISTLQEEINQWKQKYEALAKLYAQLRKEHLDLLNKFKSFREVGSKMTDEARRDAENVKLELAKKNAEYTDLLIERNRLKGEADRIRQSYEGDLARVKQELESSNAAMRDISSTRGQEVQSLVARFTADQHQLEALIEAYDDELLVLRTSLDQALLVLADYQQTSKSGMGERDVRINELEAKHRGLLYQMMDNVLSTCTTTVNEALFNFESPGEGTKSSPEFILTLIEKTQHCCTELGASYTRLVNGGDPKDAITAASALAHSVGQLLQHSKDVNILATEQEDGELIEKFLRDGATSALEFFQNLGSQQLNIIESARKPDHIINLSRTSHHHIGKVLPLLEKLVQSKIRGSLEADLGSVVAREMQNAAKAIEEATRRLGLLIAQRTELDVNSAILQSAYALTTAIANLIQCATASQLEIVQDGKASSTSAFYKKNNKWTDGLISAAQSVASATTYLVEIADGLVQGKNTWEQLVVAAQEVSVSTTQLVAASRVKAKLHSKTQDRLEAAAVAVREATKLLVKAAKDAAKVVAEHQAKTQVVSLSKHEAKVKEMEQQVKILELEKNLQTARYQLGEMRKQGYQAE